MEKIISEFRGKTKSLIFDEDEIENLTVYKYGQNYNYSVLSLLYPTFDFKNKFHIDHIFPKSIFKRSKLERYGVLNNKADFYLDNYNCLPNLQLLEGIPNQEKSSQEYHKWLDETYPDREKRIAYMNKHYIPEANLKVYNFEDFYYQRKALLIEKFKEILGF